MHTVLICVQKSWNGSKACERRGTEASERRKRTREYGLLWCSVALLILHWSCDLQVMCSSLGTIARLGQATYICMLLVTKQYNLVLAKGVISLAGEVTTGLVESNSSVPPSLWLTSLVGWLQCPTLIFEYGTTLLYDVLYRFRLCLNIMVLVYAVSL